MLLQMHNPEELSHIEQRRLTLEEVRDMGNMAILITHIDVDTGLRYEFRGEVVEVEPGTDEPHVRLAVSEATAIVETPASIEREALYTSLIGMRSTVMPEEPFADRLKADLDLRKSLDEMYGEIEQDEFKLPDYEGTIVSLQLRQILAVIGIRIT